MSEIIVSELKICEMNDAEMISSEMIVFPEWLFPFRVDVCRDDFAELNRSPIKGLG
jgi:hypothetical protein